MSRVFSNSKSQLDPSNFAVVVIDEGGHTRGYGPFITEGSAQSFAESKSKSLTKERGAPWTGGAMTLSEFRILHPGAIESGLLNDPLNAGVSY